MSNLTAAQLHTAGLCDSTTFGSMQAYNMMNHMQQTLHWGRRQEQITSVPDEMFQTNSEQTMATD